MITYQGPKGRIVVAHPPARENVPGKELLRWAATHPIFSLGVALGLGILASFFLARDRQGKKAGFLFRASRLIAAGLLGQATSLLTRFLKESLFR